jgi:hypothetical protein
MHYTLEMGISFHRRNDAISVQCMCIGFNDAASQPKTMWLREEPWIKLASLMKARFDRRSYSCLLLVLLHL